MSKGHEGRKLGRALLQSKCQLVRSATFMQALQEIFDGKNEEICGIEHTSVKTRYYMHDLGM